MEWLEIRIGERTEACRPRRIEGAEDTELGRCRRGVDTTHPDTYAILARHVLQAVHVFTKIARHKAQVRPAKGRQDPQS